MKPLLTLLIQASPVSEEEIVSKADSAKVALQQFTEQLTSDPGTALQGLGRTALQFGLKVLAALAIYIAGAWIIKRIKNGLKKMFERRKTDRAMASFISSFVSIALTVVLIIVVIGALGINTTSLAALLAAGGVAIGKFSAATQGNPLFECAFPIVLSGSKTYGPESSMPSNPVEGQLYFVVE